MKKFIVMLSVIATLALSSCGFTQHSTTNVNQSQTTVILSKKNYRIVKTVTGESSQLYVFGIGGLSKKSLQESAMSQMYKNAELKDSQAIININIFYESEHFVVANKINAIASGTVIEFIE